MPKYTVHLTGCQSATIKVEAEDHDNAVDVALNKGIPKICAQCCGWGENWARDEGYEWTPERVVDESRNDVWTGPTNIDEAIIRELSNLRTNLTETKDDAIKLITIRLEKLRTG